MSLSKFMDTVEEERGSIDPSHDMQAGITIDSDLLDPLR
jgi:hypothetical protein